MSYRNKVGGKVPNIYRDSNARKAEGGGVMDENPWTYQAVGRNTETKVAEPSKPDITPCRFPRTIPGSGPMDEKEPQLGTLSISA